MAQCWQFGKTECHHMSRSSKCAYKGSGEWEWEWKGEGQRSVGEGEWEERYGVLFVSKLVCFTVKIFIA